jgi:hypothetical protein
VPRRRRSLMSNLFFKKQLFDWQIGSNSKRFLSPFVSMDKR